MIGVFVPVGPALRRSNGSTLYPNTRRVGYSIMESGCWEWVSYKDKHGYGTLRNTVAKKPAYAHRFVYELHRGPIPVGLTLDHLCRNHACVNPDHLEPVTSGVNAMRGVGMGARNKAKTHCARHHPLTDDNLCASNKKKGLRVCRICKAAWDKKYKDRTRKGIIAQ